tara:strand:- start:15309 stop:15671 length:363 start_codon:yes stop_codon:yes gene_type:complete
MWKKRRLHGKVKHACVVCNPCPHGKLKGKCAVCTSCPHGKLKYGCKECKPCPHGKLRKSNCAVCTPCPHGKVKKNCAACKSAARAVPPSSPPIKEDPKLNPMVEIKEEPFKIHGYYDIGD